MLADAIRYENRGVHGANDLHLQIILWHSLKMKENQPKKMDSIRIQKVQTLNHMY